MVNTEKRIQDTFVNLLDKYEMEEIDVNTICKSLGIKRQTFYYHFKNIYDVIYSIYIEKKIPAVLDYDINSITTNIFTFLFKNQSFNLTVAKSNAAEVLREFVASFANGALVKILDRYNLKISERKEIARFYSHALADQCIYYFVQEEYSIKEGVSKVSYLFNEDILKVVIRKYQNNF